MKDLDTVSKTQGAGKAPAQILVHGLFGRRVVARSNAELEKTELTGKAA